MSRFTKDPDATLDYKVDWSSWLIDDTITASLWIVPPELNNEVDTFTDSSATIWLSGGSVGSSYEVVNRITTAAGRIDDRTITIRMKEK